MDEDKETKSDKAQENDLAKEPADCRGKGGPSEVVSPADFERMPEDAKAITRMMGMFMSSGPVPNPFIQKMEPEHISKVLDHAEKESEREHERLKSSQKFNFAGFIIIVLFILALASACLYKDKIEYIAPIISAIIGGFGGYGLGYSHAKKKD